MPLPPNKELHRDLSLVGSAPTAAVSIEAAAAMFLCQARSKSGEQRNARSGEAGEEGGNVQAEGNNDEDGKKEARKQTRRKGKIIDISSLSQAWHFQVDETKSST